MKCGEEWRGTEFKQHIRQVGIICLPCFSSNLFPEFWFHGEQLSLLKWSTNSTSFMQSDRSLFTVFINPLPYRNLHQFSQPYIFVLVLPSDTCWGRQIKDTYGYDLKFGVLWFHCVWAHAKLKFGAYSIVYRNTTAARHWCVSRKLLLKAVFL
jgi:hypothetical protein